MNLMKRILMMTVTAVLLFGVLPAAALDDALTGTWLSMEEDGYFTLFRFSADGSDLAVLESNGYDYDLNHGAWESADGVITYYRRADYLSDDFSEEIPYEFNDGWVTLDWYGINICQKVDDSVFPEDPETSPYFGQNKTYWVNLNEDNTIRILGYVGEEETVSVPSTVFGLPVTGIGSGAFNDSPRLKHVILPEGIRYIETYAFANNPELEDINLPEGLEYIGDSAFEYCTNLKEIVIPEGTKAIEYYAFYRCEYLDKAVLPASLERIDPDAFIYTGMYSPLVDYEDHSEGTLFIVTPDSLAEKFCRENYFYYAYAGAEEEVLGGPVRDWEDDVPWYGPGEYDGSYVDTFMTGDQERYNEAMALYNEGRFYSARQAFVESEYGDWLEMAESCDQTLPATGEIWHDQSQWLQDMQLTIDTELPEGMSMLIRIYKDEAPVSYLFLAGSGRVSVWLPGNGYYSIKDGVGDTWYGEKEAFGPDGNYENLSFDDQGTKKVYLQSGYSYTLSINVQRTDPGDFVYSEREDWSDFVE